MHQHSLFLRIYTDSNASLRIRCLFCRTIYLWPQNTPLFPISHLHWSQILSLEHYFEVCQQPIVAEGQIWRTVWVHKQFEVWFVVDPRFIHCHMFTRKLFLLRWNSCKQRYDSSTRCYFWSTVNKRGNPFEHSFPIDKCSCKMLNTLPSDIFNSSFTSHNFNLRSAKTNMWSFWCFPGQLPNLGDLSVQHHLCLYDWI